MATTQNTRIVIGGTLSTSIKSAHLHELMKFSKETGKPVSDVLNRALDLWLNVEAPVYRAHAKQ